MKGIEKIRLATSWPFFRFWSSRNRKGPPIPLSRVRLSIPVTTANVCDASNKFGVTFDIP